MRLNNALFPLPTPLLLITASVQTATEAVEEILPPQWPYNLPGHVKYWPDDPPHRRRDLEAIEPHLRAGETPNRVKKMGDYEGEKFFLEFWNFEDTYQNSHLEGTLERFGKDEALSFNKSARLPFRHPLALHERNNLDSRQYFNGRSALAALRGRSSYGFACPSGTLSCSNINQPSKCCVTDETCSSIADTGLGDVGCCPTGATCTGDDISCPANYESCPDSTGGGCCIPGYVCDGPGCVPSQSIVTVITTITVNPATGTAVIILTSTSIQAGPVTSLWGNPIPTDSALQTTLTCSPSYRACPVGLGGGCCLSDRECGVTDCPTSSGSASAPDTLSFTTSTGIDSVYTGSNTVTAFESAATASHCPIGFYGCSAVHEGGCCRTGRNCDTTDCPAMASTTLIDGGETIVVPVGTATSFPSTTTFGAGYCPQGWFNCGNILGGGCCPIGFDCGLASCSLFSGTRTVGVGPKETTSGVGRSRRIGMKGRLGGVMGVCWLGAVIMILTMVWS